MAEATEAPVDILRSFRSWVIAGLRVVALALVVLVLLPQGSAKIVPTSVFAVAVTVLGAFAVLVCGEAVKTRAVNRLALVMLLVLLAWVGLQTVPLPGGFLANPIWAETAARLGPLPATISIQPTETWTATVYLVLPLLVFTTFLTLFPEDESALRAIRILAVTGGVIAAFAIVQYELFPDTLVFGEKRFYRDSLTATFVNRNTAATFLGATALALLVPIIVESAHLSLKALSRWVTPTHRRGRPVIGWRLPVYLLLLAITLSALFLTRSRAGVGGTLIAFATVAPLLAAFSRAGEKPRSSYKPEGRSRLAPLLRALAGLAVVLVIALLFAERAAFRAAVQGTDDARFCVLPGILQLMTANWPVGTGFGTFRDAFAAYRDGECGVTGVWDRAHNVYLEGLVGLGLPAAVAMVTGIATLLVVFAVGVKNRRSLRVVPFAGFGVMILLIIHSAVDFSLQISGMACWAAALLAPMVTISLGRNTSRREKRRNVQI